METHIVTRGHCCTATFRYFHKKVPKYVARHATVRRHPMDQPNHRTHGQTQSYVFAASSFNDAHRSGTLYSSTFGPRRSYICFSANPHDLLFQCLQCDNRVFEHLPNQTIHHVLIHLGSAASTSWCRSDLVIHPQISSVCFTMCGEQFPIRLRV